MPARSRLCSFSAPTWSLPLKSVYHVKVFVIMLMVCHVQRTNVNIEKHKE